MAGVRRILILGSTGSIGTQALEVIEANPADFMVVGIAAAGSNPQQIIDQARAHGLRPDQVAVQRDDAAQQVSDALGGAVIAGQEAARELIETHEADVVLNALVGAAGLSSTLAALETSAVLALANKESLVAGGSLVLNKARQGQLVPVDSEHSAMAQCLRAGHPEDFARFVLTASGGPFRGRTREQMMGVSPQEAVTHPTWSMGTMNTINSATMVNKGLELIEAAMLFGIDPDIIDVTVHPQSVIHSMVTFVDGASIAQASPPSMKMPIAHALAWPRRVAKAQQALDFSEAHTWTFEPLDAKAFPAVELARESVKRGEPYPAVYNAANEVAVDAFFAGRIAFPHIVDVVEQVLLLFDADGNPPQPPTTVEAVLGADRRARHLAAEVIEGIAAQFKADGAKADA
ncbi:1-deoxy-D-xylulose-5-phosphate reductoisomerase [Corynebacterium sp. HMSC29G08]|uniref:1-deoxy-D-xylulose-5-phosphate reductoisomerase n=1 Tax=Corynebacterium sp. HMSC29G08 TaxID=1581069 RepID=UPI0008A3B1FB|nr:1-deoxy-D-xylulose-5-phosphate reductoisomerase [Corynebacterium sp. HMSC29G08]OFT84482.1 1-deoxy-D-xylulose-5-phosphate reductoisomerase [Corynebacterium sp. HMSC29G08]